jgi:PAS domain S-box-containing protein
MQRVRGVRVSADVHEARLQLEPEPVSAREARRFLRALLVESGHEEWLEQAELAVSEIVTNAVLHAHTPLEVTARIGEDQLRVEVRDLSPLLPLQRSSGTEATTGRGLDLVAAVSSAYGVEPTAPTGKMVWFVLHASPPQDFSADEVLARWDVDPDDPAETVVHDDQRRVVLKAMPIALWFAVRAHHNAILREYALYAAEHPAGDEGPALVALADQARTWLWNAVLTAVDQAVGADPDTDDVRHRTGSDDDSAPPPEAPAALDVALDVPADGNGAFLALQDVLDEAERLAVADRLLVRPGLPEIIAVRDWACEQVVAQLAGVASSPWPGTDQEHFTTAFHDRAAAEAPEWESSRVAESDRGVVAADDANRIVAVSRPLAAALGWDVDDLVGRRVTALVPPAMREAHVAGFSRHLSTGASRILGVALQLPVLRADGTELLCDFLIEQASTSGRPVYLAWVTPIRTPGA